MGARVTRARTAGSALARMAGPVLTVPAVLAGCSAGSTAPLDAAQRGEQIYVGNCVPCHQPDARGVPNVYPALAGSALVNGDVAPLARWVLRGERAAAMPAGRFPTRMPQYGWLNDADAAALLTHVRGHFGNASAAVQAVDVAQALGR